MRIQTTQLAKLTALEVKHVSRERENEARRLEELMKQPANNDSPA